MEELIDQMVYRQEPGDALTRDESITFLTQLQLWVILGQGNASQEEQARDWFRKHYVGVAGRYMFFRYFRDDGKEEVEFGLPATEVLSKTQLPPLKELSVVKLEAKLADVQTCNLILIEINHDLELENARLRNQSGQNHRSNWSDSAPG